VLIQAGQSGRSQVFAAKWADLVFVIYHGLQDGIREYAAFKAAVAAAGRDPASVRIAPACYAAKQSRAAERSIRRDCFVAQGRAS
jgi:alkanesulfonate monooxygenase SsuD/methylene tetrahydromethanopterin reductase-like flavin-dependent oxidoreductase (luciferase family)